MNGSPGLPNGLLNQLQRWLINAVSNLGVPQTFIEKSYIQQGKKRKKNESLVNQPKISTFFLAEKSKSKFFIARFDLFYLYLDYFCISYETQ